MFQQWSELGRSILDSVVSLYRNTEFAYGLATLMGFAALLIIVIAIAQHLVRKRSLESRIQAISGLTSFQASALSEPGVDDREVQFAARFRDIDAHLISEDGFSSALSHAWRLYRKNLSFAGAPPVRATQRPNEYFHSASPTPTWLGFAANLFVAFGLLATFLGLVAALTFASQGMTSNDPASMQAALRDLLSASASKFVTSVAGVALSILLRLVERILASDHYTRVEKLALALEFGIRVDPEAHSATIAEHIAQLVDKPSASSPRAGQPQ